MVIVRNGPIQWQSKLQRMTVDSVCEAEYIALSAAVKEVQYFRQLSNELGFPLTQSPTIFVDNESAEGLANGTVLSTSRQSSTSLAKQSKLVQSRFNMSALRKISRTFSPSLSQALCSSHSKNNS